MIYPRDKLQERTVSAVKPVIDTTKEYGLVLEGGGARGAYQIGAWQALKEAGIKIKAVSGTSVGALNGALVCMGDLEKAKKVWEHISYSRVMDVDDEWMGELFQGGIKLGEAVRRGLSLLADGGVDITPLRKLIEETVDEEAIRNSGIRFYLLTFSFSEFKELDLGMEDIPEGLLQDFLLASAYLIFFKNERLHGKKYMDGGIINNVPLGSLVNRGYKDIIMIRIFGPGREKKVKLGEDTLVYRIEPKVRLGSIMDFDSKKSRRNMKVGYYDTMRFLYGLKGEIYYIEQTKEECYYLKQLVETDAGVLEAVLESYGHSGAGKECFKIFFESVLPAIAQELKLSKNWSYDGLYIAMLEQTARHLRIARYRIYTDGELLLAVKEKAAARADAAAKLPAYAWLLLGRLPLQKDEKQED